MHQRGFLFTTTLICLTLVLAAPLLLMSGFYAYECYQSEQLLSPDTTENFYSLASNVLYETTGWGSNTPTMVRDQFYWSEFQDFESVNSWTSRLHVVDPETGQTTHLDSVKSELPVSTGTTGTESYDSHYFVGNSERLWMIDRNHPGHIFEKRDSGFVERYPKLADGTAVPGFYEVPRANYGLILDGHLTIVVETSYGKVQVFQLNDDVWNPLGTVILLDTTRAWQRPDGQMLFAAMAEVPEMPKSQFGGFNPTTIVTTSIVSVDGGTQSVRFMSPVGGPIQTAAKTSALKLNPQRGTLRVVSHNSECHLFWSLPDRLLYRRGWDLDRVISAEDNIQNWDVDEDRPASALEPRNVARDSSDWIVVTSAERSCPPNYETLIPISIAGTAGVTFSLSNIEFNQECFPTIVGGEPVVVTVKHDWRTHGDHMYGHQIVRTLRFDGQQWSEFASTRLPYAAQAHSVGSRTDGSIAYLTTTTPLGRNRVQALDVNGFRSTQLDHYNGFWGLESYLIIAIILGLSVLASMALATFATFLMCRDRGRYEFGVQSVELASLVERGVARTIDLLLITGIMAMLFGVLISIFKLDWRTMFEAFNGEDFEQSDFVLGSRLVQTSVGAGVAVALVFILLQGVFGATPGKWICGLRTLRATLKPCGIARSLLRDVLLCIDTLNFSCWFPGILFVAFTQFRQRIGDLVADTIIVRARSLAPVSTADSI